MPPVGRFTHRSSSACKETHITLQDGCFGMATLMRIAALFIPSSKPPEIGEVSTTASQRQDSEDLNGGDGSAANGDKGTIQLQLF